MTTCRDIVRLAMRKLGKLRRGQEPTTEEANDLLAVLQSIYDEFRTKGAFGRLIDVRVSATYVAGEGERIGNTTDANISITLPEEIEDAWADDEDGLRRPRDYTLVVVVGATPKIYLYSALLGAFVRLSALTLDDTAPLAEVSLDGLASLLAIRGSNLVGGQFTVVDTAAARGLRSIIANAADSAEALVAVEYF